MIIKGVLEDQSLFEVIISLIKPLQKKKGYFFVIFVFDLFLSLHTHKYLV